ncbi:MAG: hypothetical protein JXR48_14770, partial [Candidatus Delongbacteria bacterium]|nr:hypothetical protein [Candidatus Delongbacteria bacterium]
MSLETVENILEKVTADYPASRLNKGIKLYREGFVKDFILYKGKIEVVVENSKGYEFVTTIFFDKVQDLKKEILDMSKEQIISLVFDQKNIDSLEKLLDKNNWKFECTCNYKGFCEHSAAALYCFLAESAVFPLTIMNLLGLSRKDILSIITGNEMEEPDIYSDELKKDLDEVNPISYFGE